MINDFNKKVRQSSNALMALRHPDSAMALRQRFLNVMAAIAVTKFNGKNLMLRMAKNQPFSTFLSIYQNFSFGFVVINL